MAGIEIEKIINDRIGAVESGEKIASNLWSSTERDAKYAYLIWYDVSGIAAFPAKDNSDRMKIRPVLAF